MLPGLHELLAYAEQVQAKVDEQRRGRGSATGDMSAVAFLKLLVYLRKVYIEDSVYFRPKYPNFPAYVGHHIFRNQQLQQAWEEYKVDETRGMRLREISFRQRATLPEPLLMQINQVVSAAGTAATAAAKAAEAAEAAATRASASAAAQVPAVAAGPGPLGPGAAEVPSGTRDFSNYPLPPLSATITDLRSFYTEWRDKIKPQYEAHMRYNKGKLAWTALYGKSTAASKRYTDSASFFKFLDSLSANKALDALTIMEQYAIERGIKHSNMVKKVFYHMVRPGTECDSSTKSFAEELSARLRAAGLSHEVIHTKQDHSKKLLKKLGG